MRELNYTFHIDKDTVVGVSKAKNEKFGIPSFWKLSPSKHWFRLYLDPRSKTEDGRSMIPKEEGNFDLWMDVPKLPQDDIPEYHVGECVFIKRVCYPGNTWLKIKRVSESFLKEDNVLLVKKAFAYEGIDRDGEEYWFAPQDIDVERTAEGKEQYMKNEKDIQRKKEEAERYALVEEAIDNARATIDEGRSAMKELQEIDEAVKADKNLYNDTIRLYGVEAQMMMAMEEAGELITAISHFMRRRSGAFSNLIEEIADVEIMLDQLRLMVGSKNVDECKAFKQQLLSDHTSKELRAKKRERKE